MPTETPQAIRLADYRPFPFEIEETELLFKLEPEATRVLATLKVRRTGDAGEPLVLNGERLKLISAAIDGRALSAADYRLD
ncbi:MAG: hypothetical protein B7Y78_11565, partial [Caulobacter sp. 35-67-4]